MAEQFGIINRGLSEELFQGIIARSEQGTALDTMHMRFRSFAPGETEMEMTVAPELLNGYGNLHGGLVSALADTAMGFAAMTLGHLVMTVEMNINFLAPAPGGDLLTALGQVIDSRIKLVVVEAAILDSKHRLVAKGRGTFLKTTRTII